MTVLLSSARGYGQLAAGTVVELPASTEAALVAQGLATVSAAALTTGAYSTNEFSGTCAVAAAATSIVITNPNITASSKVWAVVSQAAADATFLRIERIVPAAGSVTIHGTAAATAATQIDWAILSIGMNPTT